jgi:uncharacterized repeat protein (TIGR01451 family)
LLVCLSSLTILAVSHADAATCTWTGASANANWNQAGNWSGCSVPATGDDLVFPAGAARLTNTNNFAATFALRSITFTGAAGGYILQGNAISLTAGIASANTSGTNRLSLTVHLANSQTFGQSAAAGTLLLQHQTLGLAAVQLNGFVLTFDGPGTITMAGTGAITTSGALIKAGIGQTNLNAANAAFIGSATVNAGTLSLGDVLALGPSDGTAATGVTVNSAATLNIAVTGTVVNKLLSLAGGITPATLSTTATAVVWSGPITFTGTADVRACGNCAAPTTLSGPITGSGTLRTGSATAANLGVLVLSNSANDYSGATDISLSPTSTSAGTLRLGAGEVIPNESAVIVVAPRRFDVAGQLETIGSLAGDGVTLLGANGVLTVGVDNTSTTYTGVMSGTGLAKLVKVGTGTLTLGAANTHPLTIVQAGSLLVTAAAPTMAASLTAGTLGGTGRVGALTATGGTVAPGLAAGAGILSSANVSLNASTTAAIDLNGTTVGTGYDQVDATGTVTLGGAALTVTLGFVPPPFSTFIIVNNDGVDAVSGTFAGLPQGARLTVGGTGFSISYAGGTGNDVVLTALPPPPTASADAASVPFGTTTVMLNPAVNDTPGSGAVLVTSTMDLDPGTAGQTTTRVIPGQGTFTLNVGTGQVTFTPEAAFFGTSAIGYTIADNLGQVSNVASIAITVLAPSADVSITTAGPSTATPGTTLGYTIVVANTGPADASTVIVSDPAPAGLTFVSTAGDCSTPFPCVLGTLTPGATRSITATFSIPANHTAPDAIVNTATVSTTTSVDPASANNSASVSTSVSISADLSIAVTGPTVVLPGNPLAYSVLVTNSGPNASAEVVVNASLPAGLTFVSNSGACTTSFPCALGTLLPGESRTIAASFAVPTNHAAPGPIVNTVTVSAATQDPVAANNTASVSTAVGSATDTDADGLEDSCEVKFGLNPNSAVGVDGADGDPDGDGRTNAQECSAGTHPRGSFTRYLAEGATGSFFDMEIALLNPGNTPAIVLVEYQPQIADPLHPSPREYLIVPPNSRRTVTPELLMAQASFSTMVESDALIVVERTMAWDARRYASHAETSLPSAETVWYLAEGATHGAFNLFYLIQNPNDVEATVDVTYLRPAPLAPIVKTYHAQPRSRLTIWVDSEGPEFEAEEFSAVLQSNLPIIVEHSMMQGEGPDQVWAAGTTGAAVHAPAPQWFFAEGATGTFFDTFFLLANPNPDTVQVRATYLLMTGESFTKDYTLGGRSRFTLRAGAEDPRLASTGFSTSFHTLNGDGIVAERTMWWPATLPWIEGHHSAGVTTTGTMWAAARGEVGGTDAADTYVLVANTSPFAGSIRVRVLTEDDVRIERTFAMPASARVNINIREYFPEMTGKKFGVVVESIGAALAQIAVEASVYTSADGVTWSGGSNAVATRLQ